MLNMRIYSTFTKAEVSTSNLLEDIKIEFYDEHKNNVAVWLSPEGCKQLIEQLNAIINKQTNK